MPSTITALFAPQQLSALKEDDNPSTCSDTYFTCYQVRLPFLAARLFFRLHSSFSGVLLCSTALYISFHPVVRSIQSKTYRRRPMGEEEPTTSWVRGRT